jgi:hypothetical protein
MNTDSVLQDLSVKHLYKLCVTTTTGDLKSIATNPVDHSGNVWMMGLVRSLAIDPMEWTWSAIPNLFSTTQNVWATASTWQGRCSAAGYKSNTTCWNSQKKNPSMLSMTQNQTGKTPIFLVAI